MAASMPSEGLLRFYLGRSEEEFSSAVAFSHSLHPSQTLGRSASAPVTLKHGAQAVWR